MSFVSEKHFGTGRRGESVLLKLRKQQAQINANVLTDFEISQDVLGDPLPNEFLIRRIIVHPTVSTVWAVRLFTDPGRETDPSDADYSMIYEDNWTAFTTASDDANMVECQIPYMDEEQDHTLYGTIIIKAAEAASAFMIDILAEVERGGV